MNPLIQKIEYHLKNEALPHQIAWKEMSSRIGNNFFPDHTNYKKAAVLLCLIHFSSKLFYIPFIERAEKEGPHSKQISLPGGKYDEIKDESLMHTAKREANEEISLPLNGLHILGELTPLYIPVSNFLVHPYVGFLEYYPELKPHPGEVKEILLLPLEEFLNENNKKKQLITIKHQNMMIPLYVPTFTIQNKIIWGATAMILNEFLYIYKKAKS